MEQRFPQSEQMNERATNGQSGHQEEVMLGYCVAKELGKSCCRTRIQLRRNSGQPNLRNLALPRNRDMEQLVLAGFQALIHMFNFTHLHRERRPSESATPSRTRTLNSPSNYLA